MEDKKKTLRELEARKADTLELLDNLYEKLGNSLFLHLETNDPGENLPGSSSNDYKNSPSFQYNEKKRLVNEIACSEADIKEIESDLQHLGEIEEQISRKEQDRNEKTKEISQLSFGLGRLVLSNPEFEHFTADFEQEMNNISLKIDSQQKKLEELDNSDGSFFTRLTNSVKGLVTKAQLSKSEAALDKFYRSVGEQFLLYLENPSSKGMNSEEIHLIENAEISSLAQKGKDLRESHRNLNDEIHQLKTERREAAEAIDRKGNPARRISELETAITRAREEIRRVHRCFGSCIRMEEWKDYFINLYSETDKELENKIAALDESVKDTEEKIESTRIAIAIDNEKAEIAKLEAAIKEKQQRIADTEAVIIKMEEQISESEKIINELTGKYGKNQ